MTEPDSGRISSEQSCELPVWPTLVRVRVDEGGYESKTNSGLAVLQQAHQLSLR